MSDDATPPAEVVIAVTVDDVRHEFRPLDLTPALASALRVQSHGAWRWPLLSEAIFYFDPPRLGPDEIAAVLFLARRQAGENVTYDAVAASLTGRSRCEAEFVFPGPSALEAVPAEVADDPPA